MITEDAYKRDALPGSLDNFEGSPALKPEVGHSRWSVEFNAANWLKPLIDPATRKRLVAYAALRIRDKALPMQAIAFTGLSGSIIAGPLATELECYLYAVRKDGESRHSSNLVEGPATINSKDYLIVDDFVNSGNTIRRIAKAVFEHSNARCVGIYCWRDDEFYIGKTLHNVLENINWMYPYE